MNTINDLEISLLGFFLDKPLHGYDLFKQVADLTGFGNVWKLKIGKLYAMLKKLENEGWIASSITKEGNRPPKKMFSITPSGKAFFTSWLESPVNHGRDFRNIFLLKLYFLLQSGSPNADTLINLQLSVCKTWLSRRNEYNLDESKLLKTTKPDFPHIVNKYRQFQIQGYIDWLDWCKSNLV